MKKNISINISGIIFHIEEDGYARLKDYLETINKYFSSYDDSKEIIEDIDSRVAEIFLSKLDDGKQIINADDVNALIETMGTVADFEAIEEDDIHISVDDTSESSDKYEAPKVEEDPGKRKLHRDEKRSVIGGVAAGIAYYFSIDPLWIRLAAVLLLLNIFLGAISGIVFVAYIVLWIVVPGSSTLGDDENVKKMFRDSDNQVLGGVASGISAYFGVDITLVRLLFVLSIFLGGTGFIIYIILWMITPVAHSITEKMQMQGEPVTLSNIEKSVKSSFSKEDGVESALAKVLLFPFRVIAAVFGAVGSLLGPFSKIIVEVARVIAGLAVGFVGLSGMIALFLVSGVLLGLFSGMSDWIVMSHFPIDMLAESVSGFVFLAIFLVSFIPFLVISLLGTSILLKRMVMNAPLGWAIFGIWVISIISLSFSVPQMVRQFSYEAGYDTTRTFNFDKESTVTLMLNEVNDFDMDLTKLRIRGHEDSVFNLMMKYESRGTSRSDALDNAEMVTYQVEQRGPELIFDSNYEFKEEAKFRGQTLSMTLYVPYNQIFKLEHEMRQIVRNTINRNGYKNFHIEDNNEWVFTEDGLDCLTCEDKYRRGVSDNGRSEYRRSDKKREKSTYIDNNAMTFDMNDFNEIDVKGFYKVQISQGDDYSVAVKGRERFKKEVVVKQYGEVLEVKMSKDNWDLFQDFDDDYRLEVFITMPSLEKLSSRGFSEFEINEFDLEKLEIDLAGASSAELDVDAEELLIFLSGASKLDIEGDAKFVEADISGASTLKAYQLDVKKIELQASGASNARVYATHRLTVDASGLSTVRYKGDPDLNITSEDELSTIRRVD
jgi:phage shock protein PspC (stress-responsive transcriptional regulator)